MTTEPSSAVTDELTDRVGRAVVDALRAVLGVSRIGPHDRFADLGVDSLLAMRILASCWQSLDAELPLKLLRPGMTVAGFADAIRTEVGVAPPVAATTAARPAEGARVPLSSAQRALLAHQAVVPDTPVYNEPVLLRLSGRLDAERLNWALDRLVDRHDALRCVVEPGPTGPVARVCARLPVPVREIDLRELDGPHRERQAAVTVRRLATEPLDLTAGPMRAALVRLATDEHLLLLVLHHVACDGWSLRVIVRDLTVLYRDGPAAILPRLAVRTLDVTGRQLDPVERERLAAHWRTTLDGAPELLALPLDRPRPSARDHCGARLPVEFAAEEVDRLRAVAAAHDVTLFSVLCVGVAVLLRRHTGQDDLTIGVPVADRRRPETQELVGYLVHTVPLRLRMAGDPHCGVLLREAHDGLSALVEHAELGLDGIVAATGARSGPGYTPFVQVSLVLMAESGHQPVDIGLRLRRQDVPTGTAKFDLNWYLEEQDGGLRGHVEFATDVFAADTVAAMNRRLRTLLASITTSAGRISELAMFDQAEQAGYRAGTPGRNTEDQPWQPVPTLFDRQAREHPDQIAVWQPSGATSYRELRELVDRLTGRLHAGETTAEQPVAVCLPHSPAQLAAMLAVLRVGAAVVPVGDDIPVEELGELTAELGVRVLVTDRPTGRPEGLVVIDVTDPVHGGAPVTAARSVFAEQLACVVPRRDSDGRLRAVELTHRGLANMITSAGAVLGVDGDTRMLWSADAQPWQGVLAVCQNATLCRPDPTADPTRSIVDSAANLVCLPADVLDSVVPADVPGVRTVVAAGGRVGTGLRDRWAARARFFVAHESTAATFLPVLARCDSGWAGPPPIGRPIDNVRLAVLDAWLHPVPDGAVGELYIAGLALGRGFRGRPGATAESFVPDPHADRPGTRMFRTGDLVRRTGDGLMFAGRVDRRVTIRGQHVDLDEVAAALREVTGADRATVHVRPGPDGRPQLVGHVADVAVDTEALRRDWGSRWPGHMVPSVIHAGTGRLPADAAGEPAGDVDDLLAMVELMAEDEAVAYLADLESRAEPATDRPYDR